jgi:hypothetical protein
MMMPPFSTMTPPFIEDPFERIPVDRDASVSRDVAIAAALESGAAVYPATGASPAADEGSAVGCGDHLGAGRAGGWPPAITRAAVGQDPLIRLLEALRTGFILVLLSFRTPRPS